MLHQKTMVVDDAWATIGTANFDNRSFAFNEESNVSIHDRACVTRLVTIFNDDLAVSERGDPRRRGRAAAPSPARRSWSPRSSRTRSEDQV